MAIADGFHVDSNGNLWLGSDRETFDATTRSEAPFYVYANGNLVANSGTFSGDLSAAGGTFSGDISAASGTFTGNLSGSSISGGSINIGNGTFQVDSSGNLTASSATISGYISAGGAANDINNNSTQIDGGKIVANSITVSEANITGQLSFAKLSISSQNIIDTLVDNAILDTIGNGQISDAKLGSISASKISAGTLSGFTITGASITGASIEAIGLDVTATASNAIDCAGGVNAAGVVKGSTFQHSQSSSQVGFATSYVYLRGGSSTDFAAGDENISYRHLRPSINNFYDLGTDSFRWDDVKATNGTIQTSDITLKENIVTTDLGLDFINDLTPIEFTWKAYGGGTVSQGPDLDDITIEPTAGTRTHLGFSAQDIKEKLITHKGADQNIAIYTESQYSEDFDSETMTNEFGLRTAELIPVLVKAVQELSAKNDELESRLAALEG